MTRFVFITVVASLLSSFAMAQTDDIVVIGKKLSAEQQMALACDEIRNLGAGLNSFKGTRNELLIKGSTAPGPHDMSSYLYSAYIVTFDAYDRTKQTQLRIRTYLGDQTDVGTSFLAAQAKLIVLMADLYSLRRTKNYESKKAKYIESVEAYLATESELESKVTELHQTLPCEKLESEYSVDALKSQLNNQTLVNN